MDYSSEILNKVKEMASNWESVNAIVEDIQPEDEAQFRIDLTNIDTELGRIYNEAIFSTEFRKEIAECKLAEASAALEELKLAREKEVQQLISNF